MSNALRQHTEMFELQAHVCFAPEADEYYGDVEDASIAEVKERLQKQYDFDSSKWEHVDGPVFA